MREAFSSRARLHTARFMASMRRFRQSLAGSTYSDRPSLPSFAALAAAKEASSPYFSPPIPSNTPKPPSPERIASMDTPALSPLFSTGSIRPAK